YPFGDDYEVTAGVVTKFITVGNAPVAQRVGTTTYWLHTDHLGSINVVSNASGAEVQRLKYRPYGERLSTLTTLATPRGYTAQRQDVTGLFYLHARYYDPILARFVQPDPTVPSARNVGLNHYAYAINDPVNHEDINGLGPEDGPSISAREM